MDKKKSLLNVSVSVLFKIVLLISALLSRRFLIQYVGNAANGIHALYVSIIGVLSIADLGIGTAISFCMYKPIVENNHTKVSALYYLFRKIYKIIAIVILLGGLLFIPFMPLLTKGYDPDFSISLTFITMLISVVVGYLYSADVSLINAYKNNYITTLVSSGVILLQEIVQIILLYFTKSFEIYLLCKLVSSLIQWIITSLVARKMYRNIISNKVEIDKETSIEVTKNVKAMFMHKIGGVLVNSIDSFIISAYMGVEILGKYSNYTTIVVSMVGVLVLFFTPLTAIVGHMCVSNISKRKGYFKFFHTVNFIIGIIFFVGYYSVIDNVIKICFGDDLELSRALTFVLTFNYFVQFMRNAVLLFRDATGTFYNDRWKALIEGVANLVLSLIFVQFMGIVGVIVATIITNLLICDIVEPYVFYKNALNESPKNYYFKNFFYNLIFPVFLLIVDFIHIDFENNLIEFLFNGLVSVCVSLAITSVIIVLDSNFRKHILSLFNKKKKDEIILE